MRKVSYFFVMDGRRFQSAAVLLATSLRMQMGDEIEVIAYVPEGKRKELARAPLIMLDLLKVDIRDMKTDHIDWAQPYPHGNKIIASCQPRDSDLSVFLDTDTICAKPMDFSDIPDRPTLFAVPEGVPTWGRDDEDWRPAYGMFGLDLPQHRVNLVRGRMIDMLPYFNGGFVGFHEKADAAGNRLPDLWLDTAQRLDHGSQIENKRPWLDQISLPIAAARMGAGLHVLPESYNYSLFRRSEEDKANTPHLAHYHMPAHYREWECCRVVTDRALELCPEKKRDHLRRHLGVFLRGLE